jgi:hypothetical protein
MLGVFGRLLCNLHRVRTGRLAWLSDSRRGIIARMIDFGKGPFLKDACPWLHDDAARKRLILDVVERNSVIEGLPPLDDKTRARLLGEEPPSPGSPPELDESRLPSPHNPSQQGTLEPP